MATSTIKAGSTIKSPTDISTSINSENGWTCEQDGFVSVCVQCTTANAATGVYVNDRTSGSAAEVGVFYSTSMAVNTRTSIMFPCLKGHKYKINYLAGRLYWARAY